MKEYQVVSLYSADADSLLLLCAMEAAGLLNNCEFKPRKENALDHTTDLLMRQCKAYMIGMIKYEDLYVELPAFLKAPPFKSTRMESNQDVHYLEDGKRRRTVPSFKYLNVNTPADKIPSLLTYSRIGSEEHCALYDDILCEVRNAPLRC